MWKLTDADWQAVLGVHLTGTFNMTRAAVPTIREQGYGRFVNVTSYTGLHGNVGQANYAAAKAGIIGFTRTTAKELARFGITVNAISPNAETDMVASIPEDRRQELRAEIPMGRFSAPSEVGPAVGFLASEEAGYITGVVLPVDGGLSIYRTFQPDHRSHIMTSSTGEPPHRPEPPEREPDRDHRLGADVLRQLEHRLELVAKRQRVGRRHRPESRRPGGQQQVLDARPDRAGVPAGILRRIVHDATGDDDDRCLVHVLRLPEHGVPHAPALAVVVRQLARVAFGGGVVDARPPIQIADAAPLLGIADDDPARALEVASRRRVVGGLDQPSHHGVGHGIRPEPAHRAARRHHLEHARSGRSADDSDMGSSFEHEETSDVCELLCHA